MNRLAKEKAAYLRLSANQEIDWYPWGDEAFERAKREDKPVFLSSGAIWCHWCHVMAKESFEDETIVRLLNENFICIKLDRDERPDIDRRYQQAVAAMGSGGGWPLSVFLTPDRKPFFGGTYFPPEDMMGRVGFKKVLRSVTEFYRTHRSEVSAYADRLLNALMPEPLGSETLSEGALTQAVAAMLSMFDPQNGGFGSSPKFPQPGAIEYLLLQYALTRNEAAGFAARKTLTAMANGGFHDQIGGGFHRYSTDEAWIVPHFEKMADDNAWLLRNYTDAYSLLRDDYFAAIARGIISFVRDVLSEPEGGFYASQDADIVPEDEGGYFTWTEDELRTALNSDEFSAVSLHLLHEAGAMRHDPARHVLFIAREYDDVAKGLGIKSEEAQSLIKSAKEKLLKARIKRQMPFVDRTLYTNLNGMMASAYLRAYRVFGDDYLRDFAIGTIDKIIEIRRKNSALYHSEAVKGMLDDYVYLAEACLCAYEATGSIEHLGLAQDLMDECINRFWDSSDGGFFDSEEETLGIRLKAVEDIPHPSANSVAVMLLIKLYYILGKKDYMEIAEKTLSAFSERARELGLQAGYYYCALSAYFDMITLSTGSEEFARKALTFTMPYSIVIRKPGIDGIQPCRKGSCYEPIKTEKALEEFLRKPPDA